MKLLYRFMLSLMALSILNFASLAMAHDTTKPASALTPSKTSALMPIRVQLNWNHQFQFAGFYAALMQGYYRQAGLDVHLKDWQKGTKMVDEVTEGRAEFSLGKGSVLADYAQGKPIRLVMASFQFSPLVLLSHKPINDLAQLSGKRIMHDRGLQIEGLLNKGAARITDPIIQIPSSGDVTDFINGNVDLYASYITNEPYRLKQLNIPFYVVDPKAYGIQNYGDLVITSKQFVELHPKADEAFKEATIKGWQYAIQHQVAVADYIFANFPVVKSRDALISEAERTTQFVQSGDIPIGAVDPIKLRGMAVTLKELGLMSEEALKNLDMETFIFDSTRSVFTQQELQYLEQNPVITLGTDRDWGPFEFFDGTQGYSGMSADYFKLFEERLGVTFKAEFADSWASVTKMAEQGQLDIFSCAVATPERKEYMNFTEPYLSFPMALAASEKASFIEDYAQLNGSIIAVVKDYWSHEFLKNNYPDIQLMVVDSVADGLYAVIDGRADGYLGNLAVINFNIRKYGIEGTRIVGQFQQRFELSIGVQKDNPLLFSIMKKVLASVTEEEREAIFNRWVKLKVVNSINTKQLLQIVIPALLIIFGLLSLIVVYAVQKRKQKAYLKEIYELSLATEIDITTLTITWSSNSFSKLSGYPLSELQGMPYLRLARQDIPPDLVQSIKALILAGKTWQGEMEARTKQGEVYWVDLTLSPIKGFWGKIIGVLATRINITDKKRIERLSISDVLTGLYNRRYYNEVIDVEIRRAQREHNPLGFVMLDIDLFKRVNDSYGHVHGDEVLKQFAQVLKESFNRANDYVFRMGGEEFVVICSFEDVDKFKAYLEGVREKVQALNIENIEAPFGVVTVSMGAVFIEPSLDMHGEEILNKADKMLYSAKNNGRNRVEVFDWE
ncbi:MAG: diguanylate cyclase [Thiotrichales bacterium]|nr:diguanylate cyclase [Thiotrichales bacterium]